MPSLGLDAYRKLTLGLSLAGALLFGSGLVVLVETQQPGPAALLMVLGAAAALATALFDVEGAAPALPPSLALYTRQGCALCEEARALLEALRAEVPFDLWEVDVDRDPELRARYGDLVPVAMSGGEEVFAVHFDETRVRAALSDGGQKAGWASTK